MSEPIYEYDPAQTLEGPEAIEMFLSDALDTGDATYIAKAMEVLARAQGISEQVQMADRSIDAANTPLK